MMKEFRLHVQNNKLLLHSAYYHYFLFHNTVASYPGLPLCFYNRKVKGGRPGHEANNVVQYIEAVSALFSLHIATCVAMNCIFTSSMCMH